MRHDQDAVFCTKLKEAQDLGLQFGQTKSNAIIVYHPAQPECIFKVIAKHDRRIIYERLPAPLPAT